MGKRSRLKRLRKEQPAPQQISATAHASFLSDRVQRVIIALVICALLVAGVVVRIGNLDVGPRSPDEMAYAYHSKTIASEGVGAIKRLVKEYNSNKDLQIYPSPIRIGYTIALAGIMKSTQRFDEQTGSYLSSACSILSMFALVLFGLRFFNGWVTATALSMTINSPLDLAIARRNWQDSMLALFGLLTLYSACEYARHPSRRSWLIPFCLFGAYCVTIKESGFIIYAVCAAWLAGTALIKGRSVGRALFISAVSALGMAGGFILLSKTCGGSAAVFDMLKNFKSAASVNSYILEYQTGPWYRLLEGFGILMPVGTALFLLGGARIFFIGQHNADAVKNIDTAKGIVMIVLVFVALTIAMPYGQNMRYMSVILAPFCLIGSLGVMSILSLSLRVTKGAFAKASIAAFAIILVLSSVYDHRNYERIFVKGGIRDLSVRLLRESSATK